MMSDSSRACCIAGTRREAATCRWATPTLFLDAPYWFAADDAPWACLGRDAPWVLENTTECRTCVHWQFAACRTAGKPAAGAEHSPAFREEAPRATRTAVTSIGR